MIVGPSYINFAYATKDQNPLLSIVSLFCKSPDDQLIKQARELLESGMIDPNAKDEDGNTPLSLLLKNKHFEFARVFLSYPKTDPNMIYGKHTLLTKALYFDDLDIVQFLLSSPETDPNMRTTFGDHPLDLAIRCGEKNKKLEKVKWFLAHPKTVAAAKITSDDTPLSMAIKFRYQEIVKLLLPHDAEVASIALANYEQLAEFQKKNFLTFSEEEMDKIKTEHQNELDSLYRSIEAGLDITYHAVENMSEVASILSQTPPKLDTHRLGFIDCDETLIFSGMLGWLNECFKPREMDENVSQLLKKYGFMSKEAFANWGNDKFGVFAGTWDRRTVSNYIHNGQANFCAQHRVIDSNAITIFNEWHHAGMNLYCLTARGYDDGLTKEDLEDEKIDFTKLSTIHIEKDRKISSGIIHSSNKFGRDTGGIQFLELYLEKVETPNIEIIVVDNCQDIFAKIISPDNRQEIERLEKKFSKKITFRYFQPFEELWQSPHLHYGKLEKYVDNHNSKELAYQALLNFLETFCSPV